MQQAFFHNLTVYALSPLLFYGVLAKEQFLHSLTNLKDLDASILQLSVLTKLNSWLH